MPIQEPATIVGAGIAGLATALCLARTGREVEVLERAPRLEEAGAGLQLSPNALRVLARLARLGLLDRLSSCGVEARQVTLRSGRTGRALAEVPVASSDGIPYLSILRTDLQSTLREAVEADPRIVLRLDRALTDLVRRPSGGFDLHLAAASGETTVLANRPLVIAADGVRSAIARALKLPEAVPSGLVAWRMMLDEAPPGDGIEAWLGRGLHAVAYPVAGGRKTNLVAIGPASSDPADSVDLARLFAGWDPALLERFQRTEPPGPWPLLTADRMDAALPQGLILVGDAAHAMLPFAAQGAAMAIEDAAVLAHELATAPTMTEAASRHLAARRPRIRRVQGRVDFHRFVYHLPPPLAWGRDLALALRSQAALKRDLAWLYDWSPPEL